MLLLFPVIAYTGSVLLIAGTGTDRSWRRSALRAAVLCGSYLVVSTELLSPWHAIRPIGVAAAWLVYCLVLGGIAIARTRRSKPLVLPPLSLQFTRHQRLGLLAVVLVLAVTAVVAWLAPPQTWDSLNYHMARVAHWAQNGSVRHFATGIEVQNSRPPAAEFAMLHVYLLSGGDRWVNIVQWSAMAVGVLGVSLLARQLGAGRSGQLLAGLLAATLPAGIVQASSTNTDYLTGLWVLIAASEALALGRDGGERGSVVFLALATGLGLATKPTAAAYLLPIVLYAGFLLIREAGWMVAARSAVLSAMLIGSLNTAILLRNLCTYHALANPEQVSIHNNELRTVPGVISNLVRHAALHAGTPSPHVNKGLSLVVQWLHRLLGVDENDPRTTAHGVFKVAPPSTTESKAGNPLHAYFLLLVAAGLVAFKPPGRRPALTLGALAMAGMLLIGVVFKWQIFAARYHLPFFLLAMPIAGWWAGSRLGERWQALIGLVFLIGAAPWLFAIKSRPLVTGLGETYVDSLLVGPRSLLYLANGLHLVEPYGEITEPIQDAGCSSVGLALSGNGAEYPLWAFLGAPDEKLHIEWIVAGTPSATYAERDFAPCAVICEACPTDWQIVRGLPLDYQLGEYRLFLHRDQATE